MKKVFFAGLAAVLFSVTLVACSTSTPEETVTDTITEYTFDLSYVNANPAVTVATTGKGSATVTLNETQKTVSVSGTYTDLTGPATAAHIHGPAAVGSNGGVVVALTATPDADDSNAGTLSLEDAILTDEQITDMKAGMHYINIHTAANGPGEVRGQISNAVADVVSTFSFDLSYANANPAVTVATTATGSAVVTLNETQKTVTVLGNYTDLTGSATAAHIHGPAAVGFNGGVVVALTATPDADDSNAGTLSLEDATLTDEQIADMKAGMHYINIHTAANGPGEVRGQIVKSTTEGTTGY